ncbi:MAG TPA: hypothetical protein H9863_03365 [Candidatus Odoribacter faecigallinarum]|uniref:Uncharacterized protein n=1 Tax=Candidatus Odoribacter faecigallinarum TaxID=2838706 RepID=A0A9D1UZ25_9BACT|nr:hypothetical protein [Candidatus Odoribacter faecigallinarum]
MAIFESFLLGNVTKSVSNLTMYIAKGVNVVRGKPLKIHNPRTNKQKTQRAKMKALMELVPNFVPVLPYGYPKTAGFVRAQNCFVQDNMAAVTVDDISFEATVNFEQLVCSSGHLKAPVVSLSIDAASRSMTFTQSIQQPMLTVDPTDVAWVVGYEKALGEVALYELGNRATGGEFPFELPEDWDVEQCVFYLFARNVAGTDVSRTVYLEAEITGV